MTTIISFDDPNRHLQFGAHLAAKIALVDRIQWFPGDTTGTEDHAWYVWRPERDQRRPPIMLWEGRQ